MTKKIILFVALMAVCSSVQTSTTDYDLTSKMPQLITSIKNKVARSISNFGDNLVYPRSVSGSEAWKTVPIRDWTSGFFPGILWLTSELTNDNSFNASAKKWTEGLSLIQYYPGSHDVGFMINCSYGNGYRLTQNEDYKKVLLQSAKTLITRFDSKVGCIRSWDHNKDKWQYPVIIDNMMNLELLFWAAQNGGTKEMYDVAFRHAETTMKNHFRPDGSTYHVVNYDTTNGNIISKGTHQGYSASSCWARGQAWAIYGFTIAYRFTKDERFLQTALKAADYFIANLPNDLVPYWDFNSPAIPNDYRDASAAAVASAAMLEMYKYIKDKPLSRKYFEKGSAILNSLCSSDYFITEPDKNGLIAHSVGNKPGNGEVDVTLIYGDYYFLEALNRYKSIVTKSTLNQ